ncbi:MAG: Gfo/Idh/MocA family oxidoreductase [Acidimicrobiia bacterium]|nr:Gfo/Idh/MocA family oxidoreductase [Acidimicrobiia bacterium]MDH5295434.1 Gfo/Idh/MocA family oxidoreductase [Acidimicrobiia bacterium]MDH5521340.1 Gfo/Idh/MocA family oxidoreductase [Acidimicrobiia bacterium]
MKNVNRIGLGIVGAGRIGTLRSRIAADHPSVSFLAIGDREQANADRLAAMVGADFATDSNAAVVEHPDVTAVIVATSEGEHTEPVLHALSLGKPVLVEKPLALTLAEADRIVAATQESAAELRVGYSRRFRRRYHVAKEQIVQGRMGSLLGAAGRVYNSRSQALAMLGRNPHATPVVDALTYYVDLMNWFFEPRQVVEVSATGRRGVLASAGYETDDLTWATLRYDDGAAVNLGVCYVLPEKYPALGHAARVELIGTDGVMLLDDDHTDQVMYSDHGVPHVYLPGHTVNAVFLSSGTPGDWALGEFVGPLAAETRSWLDHLATGRGCNLADPVQARHTLAVTLAIEEAARTGSTVRP